MFWISFETKLNSGSFWGLSGSEPSSFLQDLSSNTLVCEYVYMYICVYVYILPQLPGAVGAAFVTKLTCGSERYLTYRMTDVHHARVLSPKLHVYTLMYIVHVYTRTHIHTQEQFKTWALFLFIFETNSKHELDVSLFSKIIQNMSLILVYFRD